MRVRIHDSEVAAAFMGLARLRPDVVLAPAPATEEHRSARNGGHDLFEVGLIGSFNYEDRTTEMATIVRSWTSQLRGRFREVAVEVVS
jgi:hypothetical protein